MAFNYPRNVQRLIYELPKDYFEGRHYVSVDALEAILSRIDISSHNEILQSDIRHIVKELNLKPKHP
jgi:hypothetical protein